RGGGRRCSGRLRCGARGVLWVGVGACGVVRAGAGAGRGGAGGGG
ncbi:peptidoglycan-binding protein, partial [Achromobacter ruhlandii]|nr:peptidoglycan-binding protein [Achromobacter ruhlandii]